LTSRLKIARQEDTRLLFVTGDWRLPQLAEIDRELAAELAGDTQPVRRTRIHLERLEGLDTAGGWLLVRTAGRLEADGVEVAFSGARPHHSALLAKLRAVAPRVPELEPKPHPVRRLLEHLGRVTLGCCSEGARMLAFFGAIWMTLGRSLVRPARIRLTSVFHHLEDVGVNAIFIVGLLAFLIGIVMAYQGAEQLAQFGAEIFTVDLLGVSVLRELGILLTAIIVAGRSGSAFTAQIGTMKVNEEVDAMLVIGLDPLEVLVLPRLIALIIALPLLAFLANVMALAGGALVVILALDIPTIQFLRQLRDAVGLEIYLAGLVKAPVFAFLIAMVGCYSGLKVEGNAESVGRMTTQSVVVSIFLVILADALFSILFAQLGF